MREILFRGKRFDNEEWVFGNFIEDKWGDDNGNTIYAILQDRVAPDIAELWTPVRVIPETVGQFTGLYDNKGTRIFEGDIVKDEGLEYRLLGDTRKGNRSGIAIVKHGFHSVPSGDPFEWGEAYGFYFNGDTLYPTPAQYKPYCEGKGKQFGFEVIGTIYDNPELLEEGEQ